MLEQELRDRVEAILRVEEQTVPDWPEVERLCLALDEELRHQTLDLVPDALNHYLDDTDIRQKDAAYGEGQRADMWRYVTTGEMVEHAPSTLFSALGCLAALIGAVGVLAWLFS